MINTSQLGLLTKPFAFGIWETSLNPWIFFLTIDTHLKKWDSLLITPGSLLPVAMIWMYTSITWTSSQILWNSREPSTPSLFQVSIGACLTKSSSQVQGGTGGFWCGSLTVLSRWFLECYTQYNWHVFYNKNYLLREMSYLRYLIYLCRVFQEI